MPGPAIRLPTGSVDHMTTRRIRVSCLRRMRAVVVIPTFNARDLLAEAVASIESPDRSRRGGRRRQRLDATGRAEMLATRFPG